jgi:DsbC/DsbD-like thiol-disulfide interchange protein
MKPITKIITVVAFVCLLSACSRSTPSNQPTTIAVNEKRIASTDVVKATPEAAEVKAGGSGEGLIRLSIQNGYHVNANPPSFPYLKATELEIPASEGVSVGFIVYPDPITRKFQFDEQPLKVYEGETTVKVVLKADRAAKKGERHLPAKLRIQACDNEVCYAPGTLDLSIPVRVN